MRRSAVIDVGSNTVRLLVAECGPSGLEPTHTERVRLSLAREIEASGSISERTLAKTADVVREVAAARSAVAAAFAGVVAPLPEAALVIGGSARAFRRVIGPRLGQAEIEAATSLLPACSTDALAARYRIGKRRGRLLLAASLIL